jgi:hypothetical protein
MTKYIHWTYQDVTSFLAENDFNFSEGFNGSHETWVRLKRNGEPDRFVLIPFTNGFYTEKQLKTMIGQSNIAEEIWMKWNSLV